MCDRAGSKHDPCEHRQACGIRDLMTGSRSVTVERACVHAQPDHHTAVNEAEPNRRVQYCTVHQEGRVRRPPILCAKNQVSFWTGRGAVGNHDLLTKCRDGGRLVRSFFTTEKCYQRHYHNLQGRIDFAVVSSQPPFRWRSKTAHRGSITVSPPLP